MEEIYLLGVDVGTSSIKVTVIDHRQKRDFFIIQ